MRRTPLAAQTRVRRDAHKKKTHRARAAMDEKQKKEAA